MPRKRKAVQQLQLTEGTENLTSLSSRGGVIPVDLTAAGYDSPNNQYQGRHKGAEILGPMPAFSDDNPSDMELGAPGVAIIAGVIQSEEYNPDLSWRNGIRIYKKMRRSEPMINQTMQVIDMPLLSAVWKIAPASPKPEHIEQAAFIESCLFHDMQGMSWIEFLRQILLMRPFGFMLFEKVFDQVEDTKKGLPRTKWKYLAPRLPETVMRWWEGPDGALAGIQQWAWNPVEQGYEYKNIPANKLLRFTYRQEGNNYEGLPILRSAYQPWLFKEAWMKIMSVGFEREHVGIPLIKLAPGYSSGDVKRARNIGRNMRSNEVSYVTIPSDWEVDWMKSKGSERKGGTILDAIRYMDVMMQANVLAQFMSLGQSGSGSYAMSSDQSELFLRNNQVDGNYICGIMNSEAFPQLINYNYKNPGMYPSLVVQNVTAYGVVDIAKSVAQLVVSGAVRPTVELEDYIYNRIGIPRPPANLVESMDPADGVRRKGLQPDETGLTPLPLTPQEEIALANKFERNVEKITNTQNDGPKYGNATGTDSPGNRAMLKATGARPKPTPGQNLSEVYLNDGTLDRMSSTQQDIYLRMASEVGRPRIELRGDYEWVSASEPVPGTPEHERFLRRHETHNQIVDEMKQNFQDLQKALLEEDAA